MVLRDIVGCFNRTFMELKDTNNVLSVGISQFQSHLYGIESAVWYGIAPAIRSFNRTFMELKVKNTFTCKITLVVFQSHLYGIESLNSACKRG